jgi:hypothetical protein
VEGERNLTILHVTMQRSEEFVANTDFNGACAGLRRINGDAIVAECLPQIRLDACDVRWLHGRLSWLNAAFLPRIPPSLALPPAPADRLAGFVRKAIQPLILIDPGVDDGDFALAKTQCRSKQDELGNAANVRQQFHAMDITRRGARGLNCGVNVITQAASALRRGDEAQDDAAVRRPAGDRMAGRIVGAIEDDAVRYGAPDAVDLGLVVSLLLA